MIYKYTFPAFALIICSFCLSASAMDFSQYKSREEGKAAAIKIKNAGFEQGNKGWKLPRGYRIAKGEGLNGTTALCYERTDPKEYFLPRIKLKVTPGKRYRFGVWAKGENIVGNGGGGSCCIEISYQGSYYNGVYPKGVVGTTDWTLVEGQVKVPEGVSEVDFVLYIRPKMTGKVWFDDIFFEPVQQPVTLHQIAPPVQVVTKDNPAVKLRVDCGDPEVMAKLNSFGCNVVARNGELKREGVFQICNGDVRIDCSEFGEGKLDIEATVFDPREKVIYAESKFDFTVALDEREIPANACLIDNMGRAFIGGKPFLPVGLCCFTVGKKDWDRIGESPFNCVMSYESRNLRLNSKDPITLENLKKTLDYLHEKNIKLMFSVKHMYKGITCDKVEWHGTTGEEKVIERIVNLYKDHPALMTWFICDELGPSRVPRINEHRELVNRLDPFHPTWVVYYQFGDLVKYGSTSDIMGVDPYPVYNQKSDTQVKVQFAMKMCQRTGLPTWGMPQAFNWGMYNARKDPEKYRSKYADPTEEQMRAMTLLMAIYGAKGFVFYSYNDLKRVPPMTEEEVKSRWGDICRVAQMLRELEPFILSDSGLEKLKVSSNKGEVEACLFRSNSGEVRVLLAGIGPGEAEATIKLPANLKAKFKSLYGNTEYLGDNRYRFRGKDISSDILATER